MRSALASIVAAGVLALGAVPATLALAGEDVPEGAAAREGAGPPDWAPAHGHDKTGPKGADKRADKAAAHAKKRQQQAEWPENKQGPPPWAKAHGKNGKVAKQARAHAKAMQKWDGCLARAEARPEGERLDAKRACDKPIPPGRAR